jgi:hypothetical protein
LLFKNSFLTKKPDFVVSDLDALNERREICFPKLNLALCQARPHQFGERSKLGIIDRREAFPANLAAL